MAGETLYNGIVLPDPWPPQVASLTRAPLAQPPYLAAPPAVIPIDVGRQLFVDDFLIAETTLTRSCHQAQYHPASPVLVPDQPWEGAAGNARRTGAGVFSDGVWYDPADRLFKAWYWGGSLVRETLGYTTCLATSRDGVHWDKPAFDVVPGTNIVFADEPDRRRNSSVVWMDLDDPDPARRFKMFRVATHEETVEKAVSMRHSIRISFSPDGVHWTFAGDTDATGDRSTVFYNAFRKVWVYGIRTGTKEVSRCRDYVETANPLQGIHWSSDKSVRRSGLWVGSDELDPAREDLALRRVPERPWDLVPSQLYNLDCIAYESLMLGLFSIWRGHPNDGRPKINEVCVGFSRDGFHWSRPDRRAFCPVSEAKDDWNWGNVQSAGGCCLIVGDQLHVYVTGSNRPGRGWGTGLDALYTGLATLRRDGFVSMDAGEAPGMLTTRPLSFRGRRLFVNVDAPAGDLRVEVLDAGGNPVAPFSRENCVPIAVDSTIQPVVWTGAADLASVAGQPVRLRFHLTRGRLYAFWVSPDANGASHGFVAAGGPGFLGHRDTVGSAAYR